ncbi:MAG: peptidase M3 [Ignavibacteriae bacterium]|nr:peptidase M3 [Ignavibacteriota bacterium]
MKRSLITIFSVFIFIILLTACGKQGQTANMEEVKKMEAEYTKFIDSLLNVVKPVYKNMSLAYFEASVSGEPADWDKSAKYEMELNSILSNKNNFAKIKKFKETGLIQDELKARELQVTYNSLLGMQIDTAKLNAMTKLQTEITQKYNSFRAKVGKKEMTDNDVEEALKSSKDSKFLEQVWTEQKKIGPIVAQDIIKLVKMRNDAAKELGFKNYHDMSLRLSEQNPDEISKLFDELDVLTKDAFNSEKSKMDSILAAECNIKPEEMMPWHYQNRFFQEAPKIYDVDLDNYYTNTDIANTAQNFYQGLNLPINDMVAKSDLYEKPKKNQHAYCIDIDRDAKDIRVLCNIKPNSRWMETMLHEFGHALYEKYLDNNLPWIIKQPAHTFTTEAIAMMFGRLATDPEWMQEVINIKPAEKAKIADACFKTLRLQQLVFSRWSQVMYRFEKNMYENPDQDLNALWWGLVEKYQMIKKPANRNQPDWASKIHIATSPCYYHNYHLGELLASQLYYTIENKVLKAKENEKISFVGKPEVGKFLIDNVFKPGSRYQWNTMIEKATGEKLTANYYAKQFVK